MTPEKDERELEESIEEPSPEPPPPEPSEAVAAEESPPAFEGDPQELWIEEYEREGRVRKPRRERAGPRHIGRWIVLAAVVAFLVVWTLVSPEVMPVSGTTYIDSEEHSNLGHLTGVQDVRVAASLVSTGSTTWAVSVSGDPNATVDEPAVFQVTVTKVSEEMRNFWFIGTDISLRNVSFYDEDDRLIGWMVDKEEIANRSVAQVHATFDEAGLYDCSVIVRFSVYEVMRIGFLPADKVTMELGLGDTIVVSERAETGP